MKEFITQDGYDRLIKELQYLKTTRRQEIAESLKYATELGDLRENAEYDAALMEYDEIETKIYKIEKSLKHIQIVNNTNNKKINIGSRCKIKYEDGDIVEYTIVGPSEIDCMNNKISYLSPIGSSLLNKKAKEKIKIDTGNLSYYIQVEEIL